MKNTEGGRQGSYRKRRTHYDYRGQPFHHGDVVYMGVIPSELQASGGQEQSQ